LLTGAEFQKVLVKAAFSISSMSIFLFPLPSYFIRASLHLFSPPLSSFSSSTGLFTLLLSTLFLFFALSSSLTGYKFLSYLGKLKVYKILPGLFCIHCSCAKSQENPQHKTLKKSNQIEKFVSGSLETRCLIFDYLCAQALLLL